MKTKLCSKLNHEAPIDQFTVINKTTGKLHAWCKLCVKEYDHNRHKNQAPRIRGLKKKRRQEIRQFVLDLKSTLKCNRCGENDPACLVFHHINPAEKDIEIANAVRSAWAKKRILAEIAKCEVLCSNCHLKYHFYN